MAEDGTFVLKATVGGYVEGEEWWYLACKCHRIVTPDSGAFYCKGCVKHVFHMVPRYKLKMCVNDGTGDVVFVLFDNDVHYLLEKPCSLLVSAPKAENAGFYLVELDLLKDRTILFKIEKTSVSSVLFDGSYRVKRVCKDVALIDRFSAYGVNYTPTKAIYAAEQDDLDDTFDDSEVVEVPTNVISADKGKYVSDIDISQDSQVDVFLSDILVTPNHAADEPIYKNEEGSSKRKLDGPVGETSAAPVRRRLRKIKVEED